MRRTWLGMMAITLLASATPAAADPISDWWEFAGRLSAASQPPPGAGRMPEGERAITRVSLAMFEAVNAIDRRYESYLGIPAGDRNASQHAALATAAYKVLLHNFPTQKTTLDESYAMAMAAITDEAAREAGRLIGEAAALAAQAAGGIDSTVVQVPHRPHTTPGVWTATALPQTEPYWAAFRPWAIPSAMALLPPPPPPLNSERWARDYEEVRRLGGRNSTERTAHQTLIARYRQGPDLTPMLRAVADAPGRSLVQNARMYTLLQMASDDAAQAMIVAKHHYNYWRPITAIRNAEFDGNDATQPAADWVPLLGTPNFPEYPCGHCSVAGAQATIMTIETGPAPAGG